MAIEIDKYLRKDFLTIVKILSKKAKSKFTGSVTIHLTGGNFRKLETRETIRLGGQTQDIDEAGQSIDVQRAQHQAIKDK